MLVFYDHAILKDVAARMVYTNERNAEDCHIAVSGNGKHRKLVITTLNRQGRVAVGLLFDVQLQIPNGAVQVLKITSDEHGQYATAIELLEGQSTLVVMLHAKEVPGSPFTMLFNVPRWNSAPAYLPADFEVTDDGSQVALTARHNDYMTSITAAPVAAEVLFTFVANPAGNNEVMLGMATLASFRLNKGIHTNAGAYMLHCNDGACNNRTRYGLYNNFSAYTEEEVAVGSTVRCVRDMEAGTISFIINGVNHGVAFTNIPDDDLYAVTELYSEGDIVRLN
jgi:SPRY domain